LWKPGRNYSHIILFFYYIQNKKNLNMSKKNMTWQETEEKEKKNENETQWFRCMNCWTEFILGDLGLFITSEDNKLAYFCPVCGFWEFCTSEDALPESEINDVLENGPDQVYEYPRKIIRDLKDEYYLKEHEDLLERDKKKKEQEKKGDLNMDKLFKKPT
jgi:DNA-directed RNA polymerase subunit RPC12/RpoP